MRYRAPSWEAVDADVFRRLPLVDWCHSAEWLGEAAWPSVEQLNACRPAQASWRFVAQTPALLADGLHYEQRIAERGEIATRESNWHDLFNALVWLRHPALKQALNAQQVAELAVMGPKRRSRPQCAMTHFDEAGVIVVLHDPALLELWDAHDWHGLFWRRRHAWQDGAIRLELFGHALLEHALTPGKLLVGKALAWLADGSERCPIAATAEAILDGCLLRDPLELRPLPLSGIPGWHAANGEETFHRNADCYRPRRAGRHYPAPLCLR